MKSTNCIDQRTSRAVNKGRVIKNVMNNERLANQPQRKVNVGIKNANLDSFNKLVLRARKVDLFSWQYTNRLTNTVSCYGAETVKSAFAQIGREGSYRDTEEYEDKQLLNDCDCFATVRTGVIGSIHSHEKA